MMNSLFCKRYEVCQKIGSGGFGEVHIGYDHKCKRKVAIKLERINILNDEISYLHKENEVYSQLKGKDFSGIPDIFMYGSNRIDGSDSIMHYMVMDLLGPDLEELFYLCSGKFSLKTVFTLKTILLLADQMIRIIQYIHSMDYIHGDIKPGNFVLGRGIKDKMLYMVDFGLAKKYRDSETKEHIPYSESTSYRGTTRFTSLNCHQRIQQSRRDDLESLGYVLLYFLKGSLPWQGITISEGIDVKKEKRRLVYEKKVSTPIEELCSGQPYEFETYMKYCRSLQFDEEPNYKYLLELFRDLFHQTCFSEDNEFDWICIDDKTHKFGKFIEDDTVRASDVQPWEMNYFMKLQYYIVIPEFALQYASIEEILEETFRFIYVNEIPEYFYKQILKERKKSVCWKDIVQKMYDNLLQCKPSGIEWLKDNFYVDYTKKNYKIESYRQSEKLVIGQDNDNNNIKGAAKLALQMNRLFHELNERKAYVKSDSIEISDKVKGMMNAMFSVLQITVMLKGECKHAFKYQSLPSNDIGNTLILKAKPDAVLFAESAETYFPFCAMQVFDPYTAEVTDRMRVSDKYYSSCTSDSDTSQSMEESVTAMCISDPNEPSADINSKFEEQIHMPCLSFHLELSKKIKLKVPDMCKNDSTFRKMAGQLPLEMYSLSVLAEKCKTNIHRPHNRLINEENCTTLGLFIMNEYVHIVKLKYKHNMLFPKAEDNPEIIYANWCFNLKRPNDRIAFLTFLYYYDRFIESELKSS